MKSKAKVALTIVTLVVTLGCAFTSVIGTSNVAQAATAAPLTPTQEVQLKSVIHAAKPGMTATELNQWVRDPSHLKLAGTVTSVVATTPAGKQLVMSATAKGDLGSTIQYVLASTLHYMRDCTTVQAKGIFGTMFSQKTCLGWNYDFNRVWYANSGVTPDVTTYGSLVGWYFAGFFQSTNKHYYTYNGHSYGGYVIQHFGLFNRCLTKLGCIDQKFVDTGVAGHYNGTDTNMYHIH